MSSTRQRFARADRIEIKKMIKQTSEIYQLKTLFTVYPLLKEQLLKSYQGRKRLSKSSSSLHVGEW